MEKESSNFNQEFSSSEEGKGFLGVVNNIRNQIRLNEGIPNEKRKELFFELMLAVSKTADYIKYSEILRENDGGSDQYVKRQNQKGKMYDMLEERNKVIDMILPEYPIIENGPGEGKADNVGHSMEDYYNSPAGFSESLLTDKPPVIGDQMLWDDWNLSKEKRNLVFLSDNEIGPFDTLFYNDVCADLLEKYGFPRELSDSLYSNGIPKFDDSKFPGLEDKFKSIGEDYKKDLQGMTKEIYKHWEGIQNKRTLRLAKLIALFADGDVLVKNNFVPEDQNGNIVGDDNWGYNVFKYKDKKI